MEDVFVRRRYLCYVLELKELNPGAVHGNHLVCFLQSGGLMFYCAVCLTILPHDKAKLIWILFLF